MPLRFRQSGAKLLIFVFTLMQALAVVLIAREFHRFVASNRNGLIKHLCSSYIFFRVQSARQTKARIGMGAFRETASAADESVRVAFSAE